MKGYLLFLFLFIALCWTRATIQRLRLATLVRSRYAVSTVEAALANDDATLARETRFRIFFPETAFVSNVTVVVDGRACVGEVVAKDTARRIYESAKTKGYWGAIVESGPRHTKAYEVRLHLPPRSGAEFTLTYEELLVRRRGFYELTAALGPDQIVDDLQFSVDVEETRSLGFVRSPRIHDADLLPISGKTRLNLDAEILRPSATRAVASYSPSIEEQERVSFSTGVVRFSVAFDVERPVDGADILVSANHFVHFFSAPPLAAARSQSLRKLVYFVLDTSGSMKRDGKLREMKAAMRRILRDLDAERDSFSMIAFSDRPVTWRPPSGETAAAATEANVDAAVEFVNGLVADGATNVYDALERALKDIHSERNRRRSADDAGEDRKPDLVFFLTDGRPTSGKFVGEGDVLRQLNKINYRNDVVIHSLGFGDDVNVDFLERLSLMNDGCFRKIHVAPDASLQLEQFYSEVSTPLMTDLDFLYSGVDDASLTSTEFRVLYAGAEIIVAGKLTPGSPGGGSIVARSARGNVDISVRFPRPASGVFLSVGEMQDRFLERLWAFLHITQLLDEEMAVDNQWLGQRFRKEALELALRHRFVTPLTAMVVTQDSAAASFLAEGTIENSPAPRNQPLASMPLETESQREPAAAAASAAALGEKRLAARNVEADSSRGSRANFLNFTFWLLVLAWTFLYTPGVGI